MKPSIFQEFIAKVWPVLNLYIKEKANGSNKKLTYLHKERLTPVYSPDQKWEGTSAKTRYVAADMVAMDSSLPIKKRGSISKANGNLPKIGMKKDLKETDINNINIMKAQASMLADGSAERKQKYQQILAKLANDGEACSVGIDERNEYNYLYGISHGVVLIPADKDDPENTGLGLRVNYGYPASNIFGVQKSGEVCGEDIDNVISKADSDGNTPALAMLSKTTLTAIRKTRWARELAADYKEQTYTDESKLPVPTVKTFTEAFENEYGFSLLVVDRSILTEKNGKDHSSKPFANNRIIFLPNADNDGSLVWGTLAEATNPAEGVNYTTIDQYKLISRYRVTEPSFAEITKGQALVLPVIEDVDAIYVLEIDRGLELDSTDTGEEAESDAKITLDGKAYNKDAVIAALNKLGVSVRANAKDSTVISKINSLSDEEYTAFMESIKDSTTV